MTCRSWPTISLARTVVVLPTCTVTVWLMLLKPFAVTCTLYCPGSKGPELNAPEALEVRLIVWPVPVLVTTTLASLTTAPLGSVTVPLIMPVLRVVCAIISEDKNRKTLSSARVNRARELEELKFSIVIMTFPLELFVQNLLVLIFFQAVRSQLYSQAAWRKFPVTALAIFQPASFQSGKSTSLYLSDTYKGSLVRKRTETRQR